MGFAQWQAMTKEAQETARAMLSIKDREVGGWRGLLAVPPGSALDGVIQAFYHGTDIPLELPFFALLHFASGMLLERRTRIVGNATNCYADLWTVVLAPSGAGKTFAHDILASASPVKSTFPEANSGARFIEAFKQHNFELWFQDEIAKKLEQIETPNSPLADIKEYMLRAYGYGKIERSTKKETITIETPCLGVLGLNTPGDFLRALSPESLMDGFAQRFAFVWAERDPKRPMRDYPLYNMQALGAAARKAFDQLRATPIPEAYRVGDEAETAFREAFGLLCDGAALPESFFRRILFRSFKYAALYHFILGKASDTLDAEDIGWGARASTLHLNDMRRILAETKAGELLMLARKGQAVQARLAKEGKPLTERVLRQSVWGCRDAEIAAAVYAVLAPSQQKDKERRAA